MWMFDGGNAVTDLFRIPVNPRAEQRFYSLSLSLASAAALHMCFYECAPALPTTATPVWQCRKKRKKKKSKQRQRAVCRWKVVCAGLGQGKVCVLTSEARNRMQMPPRRSARLHFHIWSAHETAGLKGFHPFRRRAATLIFAKHTRRSTCSEC